MQKQELKLINNKYHLIKDDLINQELSSEKCTICGEYIKINTIKLPWGIKKIKQTCKCILKKADEDKKHLEETEKRKKLEKLFNQSNLGKRFENAKFENIRQTEHNKTLLETLKKFSIYFPKHKEKSFLIYSHGGTGKTVMASAVCNTIIRKYNKPCIFLKVSKLVKQIQETYSRDITLKESTIMDNLKKCSLLILDDLGTENFTEKTEEILFNVIDDRYSNLKSTIITTNLDLVELKNRYHTRLVSRIVEMTKGRIFNLKNEKDFRLN